MKLCRVLGVMSFVAMVTSFLLIFKMFLCKFRYVHMLSEMHAQGASMSTKQRNEMYKQSAIANRKCRKAMRRQTHCHQQEPVRAPEAYVPPCVAPSMDGAIQQVPAQVSSHPQP